MALHLKVSNSLESLAAGLSDNLLHAGNSVFDPHYIITQTEGMNNWLKLQLAARLGIAANCRFMKPNELIHQLYYRMDGPSGDVLSVQSLGWLLYKLLGEKEFAKRFPTVADYFRHSGPEKDSRRMALAEKVADLFDQYQVYRPAMIQQWNTADIAALPEQEWQQYLWAKVKTLTNSSLPDKTVIGAHILAALKQADKRESLAARIPAIYLFGLSITTAYHVEILYELSSFIDIYFYILNPAPAVYWFEDRSEKQLAAWRQKGYKDLEGQTAGNTLLTGWGRVIQDSFALLFKHDEFINAYEEATLAEPEPDSLLHKIQHDVFNAATTDRHPLSPQDISDGSISIQSCYTVAREVEGLYNYLVQLVDKKKAALSPRDIVVMVSDVDAYAPYIKAIFNNAPYQFRYTIADESYSDSDNIFNALHAILLLNEDNFKAEEVLQLLDASFIRERFNITDVDRVRSIVDAANIRFGMEGRREDDTRFVSWEYGLKRIMYGICMSGGAAFSEGGDSFYPLDLLEGSDAQELIRFVHFVEVLMDSIRRRSEPRSIADWVAYVEQVLHNLVYEPEDDTDDDYTLLMQHLSAYNAVNEYMDEPVPYDVFGRSFLQTLSGSTRSGLFVNGGITFCSLIPMRSIPFKVVALMGLNYDKFPRRELPASFNLMEQKRQRGDRNIKENDKHLFLETILSAKQYLYISYIGQSAKDNTSLPPSALVDELLDYIEAGASDPDNVRKQLILQQPLQSFSHKYAGKDTRLYSYLDRAGGAVIPVNAKNKENILPAFDEIDLEDLVRFFKNPFKAYYNKVLGIYYGDEQVLLGDTELFSLDSLQEWQLKNDLLAVPDGGSLALKDSLVKKGRLPLKNMAAVALQQVEEKVQPVRLLYTEATQDAEPATISFELPVKGGVLKGDLKGVFDGHLVCISWSGNETKYLVEAYIRYLAGAAAGLLSGLRFISGAKKKAVFTAAPLPAKEAAKRLKELLAIYKAGFEKIAAFSPDFFIKPSQVEELDEELFAKIVGNRLNNSQFASDDLYIMTEYKYGYFERKEAWMEYQLICRQVIAPLALLLPGYFD